MNNLNLILPYLGFPNEDVFYYISIIKRRKDNPGMDRPEAVVKEYGVDNLEQLNKMLPGIIDKCDIHNARCYIRLNKRSHKQIATETLVLVAKSINEENYRNVRNSYWKACGQNFKDKDKKWIIDVDNNPTSELIESLKNEIQSIYDSSKSNTDNRKIHSVIPTKSGVHIVCSPFDPNRFSLLKVDKNCIHKDAIALLYCPEPKL